MENTLFCCLECVFLVRCLAVDILLFLRGYDSKICLSSHCLAMGICVTIFSSEGPSPYMIDYIQYYFRKNYKAEHSGRAVWDINRIRSLEHWVRGFESHSGHGCMYCVRLYFVCVVLCVGRTLATGSSPVQGVLPTVYRIKNLKRRPRPNKGL
jgi:hypothetical protein